MRFGEPRFRELRDSGSEAARANEIKRYRKIREYRDLLTVRPENLGEFAVAFLTDLLHIGEHFNGDFRLACRDPKPTEEPQ